MFCIFRATPSFHLEPEHMSLDNVAIVVRQVLAYNIKTTSNKKNKPGPGLLKGLRNGFPTVYSACVLQHVLLGSLQPEDIAASHKLPQIKNKSNQIQCLNDKTPYKHKVSMTHTN